MGDDLAQVAAQTLRIDLSAEVVERFAAYLRLLMATNQTLNLTSLRDPESIRRRHFLESLALGVLLSDGQLLPAGARVLDLGSGAGFPGLPLKLGWPDLDVSLLEATGKKARFLQMVVESLGLSGASVLVGRAEALAHDPTLRGHFDLVTARAVARLPALVELSLPFLRAGGTLAAIKGSRVDEEIAAAKAALRICGGRIVDQRSLPGDAGLRLVLIEKVAATPERYPRPPGRPGADPLGGRL